MQNLDLTLPLNQPPHGFVRYIDHLGTDTTIVEAARVSYGSGSKGEEADKKLLRYLFMNRHTSPFEQPIIRYNIRMPVFCMRQFVRHRTFRLNEYSARYKELPDQHYNPDNWRLQDTVNKQSSTVGFGMPVEWHLENEDIAERAWTAAYQAYIDLLKRGVSKELARIVLPTSVYTEIFVSCDLHNLMHFLNLRTHPHAQQEIRDIAVAMGVIAQDLFPWTMELWGQYKPAIVPRDED